MSRPCWMNWSCTYRLHKTVTRASTRTPWWREPKEGRRRRKSTASQLFGVSILFRETWTKSRSFHSIHQSLFDADVLLEHFCAAPSSSGFVRVHVSVYGIQAPSSTALRRYRWAVCRTLLETLQLYRATTRCTNEVRLLGCRDCQEIQRCAGWRTRTLCGLELKA